MPRLRARRPHAPLEVLLDGWVAVSVALGMIPLVADRFFAQLPELAAKFCQNGILLGTLCAVLLNLLFNVRGTQEAPRMLAKKAA